jgi:hypothetical protein
MGDLLLAGGKVLAVDVPTSDAAVRVSLVLGFWKSVGWGTGLAEAAWASSARTAAAAEETVYIMVEARERQRTGEGEGIDGRGGGFFQEVSDCRFLHNT